MSDEGSDFQSRVRDELAPELQVTRLLGRSAVAEVFLAREVALHRLVAVKLLAPALLNDASAVRRFAREARSAARIAHSNVVTVYRVGSLSDGLPYLVMRYVKGRSLGALLQAEGPPAAGRACTILADIASAVAAGHRRRVVHRDIKPANVLVEAVTDEVFVLDFGIAAILESDEEAPERITTVGHLVGDPQFMSPERLLGEPTGERADVYNLGLIGYELFTGRGPYEAESNRGWTEAHLGGEPPSARTINPAIGEDLADLLLRCLARNPDHRPDAAGVEAELRAMCHGAGQPAASGQVAARPAVAPPPAPTATTPAPTEASDPPSSRRAPPGMLSPSGQAFRFDALGTIDLVADEGGRVLSIVAQPKRVALLAYLASGDAGGFKRRERIAGVFWPDIDDEKARHALRQAVYVLRGSLGSEAIVSRGDDEIGLDPDVVWSDVTAFERALAEGRPDCAMELYRGQLLPGFYLNDAIEFEHWLDNERNRLERLATEGAWRLAAGRESEGDTAGALHWARRAGELAPFDESLLRQLIELQLRAGDRAGALNAYETFARRLADELEAEPMPQTLELIERVRAG